jgi:hypothetical protein
MDRLDRTRQCRWGPQELARFVLVAASMAALKAAS